jgi:hypothetical protein
MRSQVNKEELSREWILDHWYEKTIFVLAVINLIFWGFLFVMSFMYGFFQGLGGY